MLRVSWCHLDSFNSLKVNCNSQRLLTEATVGAYRAGSRVDFSSTGCCVALSRSSLLPEKKLLVPFKACLFVTNRLPVVLLFVNTIFILSSTNYWVFDASEVGTGVVGMWCGGACAVLVPSYIFHTFIFVNATLTDLLAKSPPKTPI